MVSLDDRISDYIALLGEGTEEGEYLARIRSALATIRKRSQVLDFTGVTPRFRIVT